MVAHRGGAALQGPEISGPLFSGFWVFVHVSKIVLQSFACRGLGHVGVLGCLLLPRRFVFEDSLDSISFRAGFRVQGLGKSSGIPVSPKLFPQKA